MNIAAGPAAGYDVDSDPVAPHGIIGQTYDRDNIAVDGKHDDYHADVVYTSAMAEGAIEGKAADYKLAGKFDTNFKFSVFSASKAAPRDVTKLSGTQRYVGSGKPQRTGAFSDGVNLEMVLVEEDGIDGRRLDDCVPTTSTNSNLKTWMQMWQDPCPGSAYSGDSPCETCDGAYANLHLIKLCPSLAFPAADVSLCLSRNLRCTKCSHTSHPDPHLIYFLRLYN